MGVGRTQAVRGAASPVGAPSPLFRCATFLFMPPRSIAGSAAPNPAAPQSWEVGRAEALPRLRERVG